MVDGPDEIGRAQRQFDNGHVEAAAWLLSEQRQRAASTNDAARLAEIDEVSATMRARLEQDDRLAVFDARLARREPAAEQVPSGYGCALILAALLIGCVGFLIGAILADGGYLPASDYSALVGWALIFGIGLPVRSIGGLGPLGRRSR